MNSAGLPFVLAIALLAMLLAILWMPLLLPGILLTLGVYLFFRDPDRVPPKEIQVVVSPADGLVSLITQTPIPAELQQGTEPVWRVSVFMSVLNVHVNRMPIAGEILKMHYIPGKFFNASLDKASEANERKLYLMRTAAGQTLACVQIAGLIARRIVSFAREGQTLALGERFGLIRFGSRLDIYLPAGVEPDVRIGQTMVAGETIIARL